MTNETYEDPESRCLFGLYYSATHEQANRVWLQLIETSEWLEFETLQNITMSVEMQHDEISSDVCRRLAIARAKATSAAYRILAAEGLCLA